MSKKTPSVTVPGRKTEWNMPPDLEQFRFGASRGASPLPTAATGPSEAAMGNHTGESPQEVSIVRTDTGTPARSRQSAGPVARREQSDEHHIQSQRQHPDALLAGRPFGLVGAIQSGGHRPP